jgi:hypothetical protein
VRRRPGGASPFYRGPEGAEESGLHGQRQCLGLKAPVTGVKRGRGCDYGQLMRGRVKRGKSQSLGLHGVGGREGVAHMAWVVHRGGGDVGASSGWRREGERDPWPLGRLDMLVDQRVGPKATASKGQTGWRGCLADWVGTEENCFSK